MLRTLTAPLATASEFSLLVTCTHQALRTAFESFVRLKVLSVCCAHSPRLSPLPKSLRPPQSPLLVTHTLYAPTHRLIFLIRFRVLFLLRTPTTPPTTTPESFVDRLRRSPRTPFGVWASLGVWTSRDIPSIKVRVWLKLGVWILFEVWTLLEISHRSRLGFG